MGTMDHLKAIIVVALAVAASGCVDNSPEIVTSTDRIELEGNSSSELTFQVKNNYDRPDSFTVEITKIDIAQVNDSLDNQAQYVYFMGDAPSGSVTRKKTVIVTGNPGALGSLDSGSKDLKLRVFNSSQETTDNPLDEKEVTVEVER